MLAYAYTPLTQSLYKDIAVEQFENIHNLLAAILAKGISKQLKQGLYREYINYKDHVTVARGKIKISGTIQNIIARKRLLSCEYDELSENNLLNQIIKTTLMILLRHGDVETKRKAELKRKILFFSNVDTVNPKSINWSEIRFHRNDQTYRMLIGLCRLTLEGLLLTTDDGKYKLASFIFDEERMNNLYEKFILNYYKKEYPQLNANASLIKWALDEGESDAMLPKMKTDITLSYNNTVLIIDAKYYSHITVRSPSDHQILHSDDLYQIFSYVKNMENVLKKKAYTISGMLLYARTNGKILPDIMNHMCGNKISVKTLDLNCNFNEIAKQLYTILTDHFNVTMQVNMKTDY